MNILRRNVLAVATLSAAMLLTAAKPAAAAALVPIPPCWRRITISRRRPRNRDAAALSKLLDADFLWIDANGRKSKRAQVVGSAPKSGLSEAGGADLRHDYGQVETVEANSGKMHVLRVWVKRPAGWRALVYQEVQSLDAPPKTTPSASQDCQNPCKSVGYTPKTETERAIITAYEGLETSAMTHNAADWDAHTGEEFIAASSYSDRLLDKPTRLGELKRANMAGLAPTPLVSGRLFVFGDAAVLRSHHVANQAKPLEVTRVFVKRDGKWVEVVSYQTAVQGGGAS